MNEREIADGALSPEGIRSRDKHKADQLLRTEKCFQCSDVPSFFLRLEETILQQLTTGHEACKLSQNKIHMRRPDLVRMQSKADHERPLLLLVAEYVVARYHMIYPNKLLSTRRHIALLMTNDMTK